MKILYSELKQFIPALKASPKAVAHALSLTGLLVDVFEEKTIGGKKDVLLGVEVRQNRPDCLGVIGVAREVAAYFGVPVVLPKIKAPLGKKPLQVEIKAANDVKRAAVIEVHGLNNAKPTPVWLREIIEAHGMNSVSFLVDISNYAMLMTGYPNHLFDAGKIVGGLLWQRAPESDPFTTLDGTVLELHKGKELVISDNLGPVVLASAVGGRRTALSERTTSVLAEVAVYDGAKVRGDAKGLGVVTEASNRLEKDMSPEFVLWALEFLADCLVQFGGGTITSAVFDYYPKQHRLKSAKIVLDAELPSIIAGIPITVQESERYLKRLGFGVSKSGAKFTVTIPSWRLDVATAPDVAEEIIRMKGFDTITPRAPRFAPLPDITPARIKVADSFRVTLSVLGYDEVLTLPMTTVERNAEMVWEDTVEIRTQNAVNEEFPVLRQSLAGGLLDQHHEYLRKGIYRNQIFEIGKVFGKQGRRYVENERVGMLYQGSAQDSCVAKLYETIQQLLRSAGVSRLSFERLGHIPRLANPHAAWLILVSGKSVGVVYQLKDLPLSGNRMVEHTAYAEVDLELVIEHLASERPKGAEELTEKLVVLDANVEADSEDSLPEVLQRATKNIGRSHIWSLEVVDSYKQANGKTRYTLRISYRGMPDGEAKGMHDKAFSSGVAETDIE